MFRLLLQYEKLIILSTIAIAAKGRSFMVNTNETRYDGGRSFISLNKHRRPTPLLNMPHTCQSAKGVISRPQVGREPVDPTATLAEVAPLLSTSI